MTTVLKSFESFRSNLELTGLQGTVIAERQKDLRQVIGKELLVVDSFLTGSYRRNTLIAPLSKADVDVMVVLDRSLRKIGPANALNKVRQVLVSSFPTAQVSRNGQAITVTFRDFLIDVVPAFAVPWLAGSGWDICDSGGMSWLRTNPDRHSVRSTEVNDRTGGLLVPTVKMLKAWNRTASQPLRSFHLEALAWSVFDPGTLPYRLWGVQMATDPENVHAFFSQAPALLTRKLADPATGRGDLGSYLSASARKDVISKIGIARQRCELAESLAQVNDLSAANATYRDIFGSFFPA